MGNDELARESAARLKAQSRKVVTAPRSGVKFEIRRLIPRDFVEIAADLNIDIPSGATLADPQEPGRVAPPLRNPNEERAVQAYYRAALERGVLAPMVIFDDDIEAGEGMVNLWDIPPEDVHWLVAEISEFSGLGVEARAREKFREGSPADDGIPGPVGETIPPNAT
jgi:hypothetical protein